MARVYFTYTRKFVGVETGTVSVDISDPQAVEDMKAKLEAEDFATFLPESREISDKSWHYEIKKLN